MKKFSNNMVLTLDDLESSGMYDQKLLDELKTRNFKKLLELPMESRSDIFFMEPLLFAIKNTFNTFQVYAYYSESLQDNVELASKIVVAEPNLIENTPISNNKKFIEDNVNTNPEIIKYMSSDLKSDNDFIYDLSNIDNPEVKKEIAQNCDISAVLASNKELRNDKDFMSAAISSSVEYLKYASDELKNDETFLKEKSSENENIIDYVVDNIEDFGIDGIKGVRESSRNFTTQNCMDIIEELAKTSSDKRYLKVKEKIKESGLDDKHAIRWITAMVAQDDNVDSQLVKRVFNYSILTMEKTKRELLEKGEESINIDNVQELITPSILNKLKEKLQLQGIDIDPDIQQKLDEYKEFYDKYYNKFKERKLNKAKINSNDIDEIVKNVKLSDIKLEIQKTRELIVNKNKYIDEETKETEQKEI